MSSATGRKIKNEEQYQNSLNWLVKTSIELEDPLISEEEKAKKRRIYDFVSGAVQSYRRGELAGKFPELREVYLKLGWQFNEPKAPGAHEEPVTVPQEQLETKSNYADFLDD